MTHFKKTFIVALYTFSVFAQANTPVDITHSSRDISEKVNTSDKERFMYNKGFKDGYEVGKREGYALAQKESKQALNTYKNLIKGYEAGKYISKKGKITPPRVYQRRGNSGAVSVIVKGCELRGELSPSDILLLPQMMGEKEVENFSSSSTYKRKHEVLSDGVFLSGIDNRAEPIAKSTQALKQVNAMVLRDTKFYRDLLRSSGVLYSIEENGGGLKAIFSTPREKKNFIKNYGLEYGKDYE